MTTKLYVGNLAYQTTGDQLHTLFAEVGQVVEASVIEDRETGRSRGFAFVQMADETAAQAAIAQLNGKELDGRSLNVAEAKPREQRETRGRSRW